MSDHRIPHAIHCQNH